MGAPGGAGDCLAASRALAAAANVDAGGRIHRDRPAIHERRLRRIAGEIDVANPLG